MEPGDEMHGRLATQNHDTVVLDRALSSEMMNKMFVGSTVPGSSTGAHADCNGGSGDGVHSSGGDSGCVPVEQRRGAYRLIIREPVSW